MPTVSDQLAELTAAKKALDEERAAKASAIDDGRKSLQSDEQQLDAINAHAVELQARFDATTQLKAEVASSTEQLEKARVAAAAEAASAATALDQARKDLEAKLPQAEREELTTKLRAIDDAIADAAANVAAAEQARAEAEAAVVTTQLAAVAAEADHAQWRARFQALQQGLDQLRARVAVARAAMQAAIAAGRPAEAYVRSLELGTAIGDLKTASGPEAQEAATNALPALWEKVLSTAAERSEASTALELRGGAVAAAQRDLGALVTARDGAITELLAGPPPAPPADADTPVAPPVPVAPDAPTAPAPNEPTDDADHGEEPQPS